MKQENRASLRGIRRPRVKGLRCGGCDTGNEERTEARRIEEGRRMQAAPFSMTMENYFKVEHPIDVRT
jgi:hypothetical protein